MTSAQTTETRPLGALLESARRRLNEAPFRPSTREAVLLASRVSGLPEATILAHPETHLDARQVERFEELLARRLDGEPVAYLLGEREFFGRAFTVDDRVLIPRPETEHLVELALTLPLPPRPTLLDLGTGSGAIALSLALEIREARVVATDRSPAALAVAAVNRNRWQLGSRVDLVAADLAEGLDLASFDLVVSNPPYISPGEAASLSDEITRFEPPLALFAPPDGLDISRRMLAGLEATRPGTWLALEIGRGQSEAVLAMARDSAFEPRRIVPDYAGIPRVALFQRE